jgi:hypothetical protein
MIFSSNDSPTVSGCWTHPYLDGASLDDLGVLCGCTAAPIRRILVAHGVEIRPRGHNHGKGRSTKFVRR